MDCTNISQIMNITDISGCYKEFAVGSMIGAVLLLGITIVALLLIGLYVYTSLAWMTIAKKLKYKKAWLAWIPIANISMILQLGKFHWAWVFLILIPILGWIALLVLIIISTWRIFEKRKYPGWLSLIVLLGMLTPRFDGIAVIAYLVVIGLVAWKDKK